MTRQGAIDAARAHGPAPDPGYRGPTMERRTTAPSRTTTRPTPAPRGPRPRLGRALGVGLALTLVAGLGACGDDDDTASDDTVAAEIGDAATVESSTTAADTTTPETTPTTAAVPVGAPDPETAAATLYGAWKAGDVAPASSVAEPAAIESMATVAAGDYTLYNRCNTGEFGQSSCLYRGDPGTIQFSMADRGGLWVVTTAIFSPA